MKNKLHILILIICSLSAGLKAQVQSRAELNGKAAYIQGMEAFAGQDFEQAKELLLTAYTELDGAEGVAFALADTYLMLNDLPNAALYGKQAVDKNPSQKWYRLKLAEIYRSAGQNEATIRELTQLIELFPKDVEILFTLAETYKSYGDYLKSNAILDKIINTSGPDQALYYLKFENFEALGARDSALVQLEKLQKLDPDNLRTLNLLSRFYSSSGKESEAKSALSDALERNARDPQTLINLAEIYINEQKWDSAGTLVGNFFRDDIILPEQKFNVAQFLYTKQRNEPQNIQLKVETARALDIYTEAAPTFAPAFGITGQFYVETGDNEAALKNFEKATELLPGDDVSWRQRIQLLLMENRTEDAIKVGVEADRNVPDDAFIQFFVGTAFLIEENYTNAIIWFEKASNAPARRPFKSSILSSLGDAYSAINNYEEADASYELALRYDPENHLAMNNYAYNLSVRGIQLERAKELALAAIEVEPENSAYLDTVGWVYFKLEDYDRARRYIKASIDIGEASAEVLEHMGDVYEKLGNIEEAKKWWKQALDDDSTRSYLKEKLHQ